MGREGADRKVLYLYSVCNKKADKVTPEIVFSDCEDHKRPSPWIKQTNQKAN